MVNLDPSNFGAESDVDWDNVGLSATAVPEPAALGLFTLPALAWMSRFRRDRRAQRPA